MNLRERVLDAIAGDDVFAMACLQIASVHIKERPMVAINQERHIIPSIITTLCIGLTNIICWVNIHGVMTYGSVVFQASKRFVQEFPRIFPTKFRTQAIPSSQP